MTLDYSRQEQGYQGAGKKGQTRLTLISSNTWIMVIAPLEDLQWLGFIKLAGKMPHEGINSSLTPIDTYHPSFEG